MSLFYFLNPDHSYRPCDVFEWGEQFEKMDRHIADEIVEGKHVSTVWLGNDHNFFGGPPLLLETMVFDIEGSDIYMRRYTTWEQAVEGHKKAVEWVKSGCPKED